MNGNSCINKECNLEKLCFFLYVIMKLIKWSLVSRRVAWIVWHLFFIASSRLIDTDCTVVWGRVAAEVSGRIRCRRWGIGCCIGRIWCSIWRIWRRIGRIWWHSLWVDTHWIRLHLSLLHWHWHRHLCSSYWIRRLLRICRLLITGSGRRIDSCCLNGIWITTGCCVCCWSYYNRCWKNGAPLFGSATIAAQTAQKNRYGKENYCSKRIHSLKSCIFLALAWYSYSN